jgi:hypothetical protein
LIDVGEDDLPDCRMRDETWELVDEKFRKVLGSGMEQQNI